MEQNRSYYTIGALHDITQASPKAKVKITRAQIKELILISNLIASLISLKK
jgi:hypothetical protein